MTRLLPFFFCFLLGLPMASAQAQQQGDDGPLFALSETDRQNIDRIVTYLNGVTTFYSRFAQFTSLGGYAEGEVWMQRPGKMRFEYGEPSPFVLLANGITLLYYDRELEEATHLPLWETPLWFLLREKVEISDNVEVVDVSYTVGGMAITMIEKGNPEQGVITVNFTEEPIELVSWEVIDAQGIVTRVALLEPQFGVTIPADRFQTDDLPGAGLETDRDSTR